MLGTVLLAVPANETKIPTLVKFSYTGERGNKKYWVLNLRTSVRVAVRMNTLETHCIWGTRVIQGSRITGNNAQPVEWVVKRGKSTCLKA